MCIFGRYSGARIDLDAVYNRYQRRTGMVSTKDRMGYYDRLEMVGGE